MQAALQEVIKFEDVLCQFADLLHPAKPGHFRVEDFLNPERVKLTGCFFNALFDLNKFHRFEAREAKLVKQGDNYDASHSQWNAYAVSAGDPPLSPPPSPPHTHTRAACAPTHLFTPHHTT